LRGGGFGAKKTLTRVYCPPYIVSWENVDFSLSVFPKDAAIRQTVHTAAKKFGAFGKET